MFECHCRDADLSRLPQVPSFPEIAETPMPDARRNQEQCKKKSTPPHTSKSIQSQLPATILEQPDVPTDHLFVIGYADALIDTVDPGKLIGVEQGGHESIRLL